MSRQSYLYVFLLMVACTHARNLMEEISSNPNFSKFKEVIETSRLLPILLESKEYTAFIPTNEAMEKYDGIKNGDFVHYHLANIAHKIQELPDEVMSDLTGNPVLYVTRIKSGKPSITGWEDNDIYINNAKVISANHRTETVDGAVQYLHTIDQVINPTIAQVTGERARQFRAPDARKVLENSNIFDLKDKFSLRDFYNRANELNALESFEREGKNTFFIPVDQALKAILNTEKEVIDKEVVMSHIVPDEVFFTRTVQDYRTLYPSLAQTDDLSVYIALENVTKPETNDLIYYVKSSTVKSDAQHMKGSAMARIVKANIPVKNGVIHLIDRPLTVVAPNIMSYLQEEEGQLSEFHKLMTEHYMDLTNHLMSKDDMTLFAPSNKAFKYVNKDRLNKIIANKDKLKMILQMHIINRRLTTDEIVEKSRAEVFQEKSMAPGRNLYFAAHKLDAPVPEISLEGGGVNATVTTPNIATKNGIIHIVDRIFGIPSQTVFEKLASDPMLSSTFSLSEQEGWNARLNDRNKKFTLFVPSNNAWNFINREMPSAYKKLFMGKFSSHVKSILQRHMIVNEALKLEELQRLTTTNSTPTRENMRQTQLQMTRGKIYFQARVRENFGQYYVEYNGISARVVRPDVECVNGVVHVIDRVLMVEGDVTVNGGTDRYSSGVAATVVSAFMSVSLAWFLI